MLAAFGALISAQRNGAPTPDWDWPTYNRDLAGTRYSPLTQINTKNVSTLVPAWSYRLRPEPGRSVPAIDKPASSFEVFQQVTPIVVNKELWSVRFDYNATAIPITYMGRNGKQYVAVVAATQWQGNDESLRVFALP
jgi:glucose dehydrogenase